MLVAVLLIVASASYLASVLLGVLVGTRIVDTSGFHWLHHALYVCTFVLAAAFVVGALVSGPRFAGWLLAPVLIPFALIPFLGTRGLRHPIIGSVPLPFYVGALIVLARG